MTDERQPVAFARTAEETWRRTLAGIPNAFGALVYLSTLRDPQTARYAHHGLQSRYGDADAGRVLLSSHQEVFQKWIAKPLAQQKYVLEQYLDELPGSRRGVVEAWLSVGYYRSWMPVGTPGPAQEKFLSDSETLLRIILNECDPDPARPGASRQQ